MTSPLLARRDRSQLVLVDVQEKLCRAMPEDALQVVLKQCGILLAAAQELEIPVLVTEQYPQGLGPTLPQFAPWLENTPRIEKTGFSCWQHPGFRSHLPKDRSQVVLAGMEAHICIVQTALDLHAAGRQVFVAEDAVISRHAANKANAMARLAAAGIIISNTESLLFEWLGAAEGESFKRLSQLLR